MRVRNINDGSRAATLCGVPYARIALAYKLDWPPSCGGVDTLTEPIDERLVRTGGRDYNLAVLARTASAEAASLPDGALRARYDEFAEESEREPLSSSRHDELNVLCDAYLREIVRRLPEPA